MYYKGGNLIHMIRQIINDDESFRKILRGLNKVFYHKTVDSKQVEDFISHQSGIDFSKTFDQYLRTTQIPVLEYKIEGNKIVFRWTNCIKGFNMPVKLTGKNFALFLYPVEEWRTLVPAMIGKRNGSDWAKNAFDPNFYVTVKKVD